MIWRTLGYPIALLAALAGTVPAVLALRGAYRDGEQADVIRLHVPPDASGRREVRVEGKAQGEPAGTPLCKDCLIFSYAVSRTTGSGKNRSTRTICSASKAGKVEVETASGERFGVSPRLPVRLLGSERDAFDRARKTELCAGTLSTDGVSIQVLQRGDPVEVWACLQPGTTELVPCSDGADSFESPPQGGPLLRLRNQVRTELALMFVWLSVCVACVFWVVSARVMRVDRRQGSAHDQEEQA